MKKKFFHIIFSCFCFLIFLQQVHGQEGHLKKKNHFFNNIFKKIKSSITVSQPDSTIKATILNTKSVIPFSEYEGKVIRNITTQELGFEKVFTDTSKPINYYGTRILNALHTDTYDWVIRDNLFIKKGTILNPYVLSDNERYIRSLEFIQDARIVVKPISGNPDSVDIVVITKDLFSITGSLDISGADRQKLTAAESNLAGAGQKIQVTTLRDTRRQPTFGYDFLYSKNSVLHSFITATLGQSRINSARTGRDNVRTAYLLLSRPLFSPYSRFAGGLELRLNKSENLYRESDSLFRNYKNESFDVWAGYNIGLKKLLEDNKSRNRTFVAIRYIRNNFLEKPIQFSKGYNTLFNNINAVLGEVTFFKQEFYKTNYIYNFGTTEDVPYGYNVALTTGWYKQLDLARPYFGVNANRYVASERGKFTQYYLRSGVFFNQGRLEDASVLAGGSLYSKLYLFRHFKMRQYLQYSYTRLFNRVIYDPVQINNPLGLRNFRADTLRGSQRVSLYAESLFFAKLKLFGFQLAPFGFAAGTLLTGQDNNFKRSDIYTGLGGGLRTRNVNLIFATAEVKLIYFPRKAQNMNAFQISFNGNIRFRYNSNYVRPPDIIQLNTVDVNNFYQN
ncbi:hypothetical protein [Segetibacter koreensis]|uniref:hypothetical protein n=1 Tax=Segetibacter koreensis TaxID=398037 RepID=UPI0003710448|nr:hypothetical protein [Segetibacter koreensis]